MAKDAITPEEKIHLLWIQNITMLALLDDATFKIFRDDEVVFAMEGCWSAEGGAAG